jgi:putative transposase
MLKYKAARSSKGYIEMNRFFPLSKTCSRCLHQQERLLLNARNWNCNVCGVARDRDINASQNIRNEEKSMTAAGTVVTGNRCSVSQSQGRKSSVLSSR